MKIAVSVKEMATVTSFEMASWPTGRRARAAHGPRALSHTRQLDPARLFGGPDAASLSYSPSLSLPSPSLWPSRALEQLHHPPPATAGQARARSGPWLATTL